MRVLVESWPQGVREESQYGHAPLYLAARSGRTDVVRLLIESWPEGKEELREAGFEFHTLHAFTLLNRTK
jgi:hypothetical protein